jgi:uncharacterized protein (TIGR03905 family)
MIFKPNGVCSKEIEFEIEENRIKNVRFSKGCDGNLKAISILIEGMEVDEVISKLKGIKCGRRNTSCTDQLVKAIEKIK